MNSILTFHIENYCGKLPSNRKKNWFMQQLGWISRVMKWLEKPVSKCQILCNSMYMTFSKWQYSETGCQGLGLVGGGVVVWIKEKRKEMLCGDGIVLYCDCGGGDVTHTRNKRVWTTPTYRTGISFLHCSYRSLTIGGSWVKDVLNLSVLTLQLSMNLY